MKVYLGADHRGFLLKEKVRLWLEKNNILHEDLGAHKLDKTDDYTTYAERVASIVAKDKSSKGILFCGSGVGVDVTANKFDGIRSSLGINPQQIEAGRNDDDMNVLVIAADYTIELHTIRMIEKFLHTPFSGKERYKHRIEEIARIEENN